MPVCNTCRNTYTRVDNNGICHVCRMNVDGNTSNETIIADITTDDLPELPTNWLNEPINNLNGGHILKILLLGNTAQSRKLDDVVMRVETLERDSTPMANRVKLLEKDLQEKSERIDTLESIIINMQKSINMIDFDERATNVMISGLSEGEIIVPGDENTNLKDDDEKVKNILDAIDTNVNAADIREISRIGKPKENYTRLVKVKFASKDQRKLMLDNSAKLKEKEHLNKVYIKKDTHPVYVQETNRIRLKMKKLLLIPEHKDKVKIVDGKLELDGVIIDKNTFFV